MSFLVGKPTVTTLEHIENIALRGARCTKKMRILIDQQKKSPPERVVVRCDTTSQKCAIAGGALLVGLTFPVSMTLLTLGGLTAYGVGRCVWGECHDRSRIDAKAQKVFMIYDRVVTFVREKAEAKQMALREKFNALSPHERASMSLAQAALKRIEEEYDKKPDVAKLKHEIGLLQNHVMMDEVCAVSLSVGAQRNIQNELENACGFYLRGKEKEHQTYVELKEAEGQFVTAS